MDFDKINAQMQEYVDKNEMAGGALIIRRDGELLYKNKWGYTDVKTKTSVEYDTIYKMASVSKVFTAIGILKLIEQGKVGLDDEITKYLPEFSEIKVAADERYTPDKFSFKKMLYFMLSIKEDKVKTTSPDRMITVRDLLTHTSGIETGIVGMILGMKMKGLNGDTLETRINRWVETPLDFQPGTVAGYSLTGGFDTLARICEVVSGKRFSQFMQEEIYAPLTMKDTSYHPNAEQLARVQRLYKTVKGKHKDVTGGKADITKMGKIGPNYDSGAAGVYTTIEDMDKIALMLASDGELNGIRILNPETVKSIYCERAYKDELEFSPGMKWGLGMLVRDNPEKAEIKTPKDTYGWSGAFGAHLFVCPHEKLSVSFAMNRADIGGSSSYIIKRLEELMFE